MPKNNHWQNKDPFYKREQQKYGKDPLPSREYLIDWLKTQGTVSFQDIATAFNIKNQQIDFLEYRIKAMISDCQLYRNGQGNLEVFDDSQLIAGSVFAHPEGYGFFIYEEGDDGFIPPKAMQNVMHEDQILARISYQSKDGKKEFQPVKIIKHGQQRIVGKIQKDDNQWVLIADNKRITQAIVLDEVQDIQNLLDKIVVAEIYQYPQKRQLAKAKIIQTLGKENAAGMETTIAIETHQLPYIFPDEVLSESEMIAAEVSQQEIEDPQRVDFRHLPFVTIDGLDSRDFDDAVYAEERNGNYALFVAIADVGHYVAKDSALDQEAYIRGTSVYFPNQVIPMLPERLSNGICSLNPLVDRLTLVCEMTIDAQGIVKRSKFHEAVIQSQARLTYDAVEEMLFNNNQKLADTYPHVMKSLKHLKAVYQILLEARNKRHAIDFEVPEPVFEFDSEKKISSISAKKRLQSHRLIEECMVVANVTAAKFIEKHKIPALYRVHDAPNEERLNKLITFVKNMGIHWQIKQGDINPGTFTTLLDRVSGKNTEFLIKMRMLRSMMQAVYSNENRGHFGLALENYAHFTSPIRRYPDLLVHRAIRHIIRSDQQKKDYIYNESQMSDFGLHCSLTERRAEEASRDAMAYLKCEFMSHHLGETFTGRISNIKNFGFFVDLDTYFIDGLVHISSLTNDYYQYNADRDQLIGERSGRVFSLLDHVSITVAAVNIEDKKIDFVISDMKANKKKSRPTINKKEKNISDKKNKKTKKTKQRKSRRKKTND